MVYKAAFPTFACERCSLVYHQLQRQDILRLIDTRKNIFIVRVVHEQELLLAKLVPDLFARKKSVFKQSSHSKFMQIFTYFC